MGPAWPSLLAFNRHSCSLSVVPSHWFFHKQLRDKSPGLAKVPSPQAAHWASPGSSFPVYMEALCISPHPHPHHAHWAVSLRVLASCSGSLDSS